jgi:cbb3-type cytochrome oxidase maturation protein
MDIFILLIPASTGLGCLGLLAVIWTLKHQQYEDPSGDAEHVLNEDYDKAPKA